MNWLVDDALHMDVPIPVISQSVMPLLASRDNQNNWARAIAMMRHGFGGHPFGGDDTIARARRKSRIGGFPKKDTNQRLRRQKAPAVPVRNWARPHSPRAYLLRVSA
ncbi:MAG: hypothetical protein ACT4PS_14445 [Betaproteobacteria bacterium]